MFGGGTADTVGLLCLQEARSGGLSAQTVHNIILDERPLIWNACTKGITGIGGQSCGRASYLVLENRTPTVPYCFSMLCPSSRTEYSRSPRAFCAIGVPRRPAIFR